MLAVRVLTVTATAVLTLNAQAASEQPAPAATTVAGTAFGDTFKAGYAYAKRDPNDGSVFVFFGNGKNGGCDVTSVSESAYVGMNHPAKAGTYTATPAEAYYSTESLEPRPFESFKIEVKEVNEKTVRGTLEMTSMKGKIAGDFNAAICPGTN